MLELIAVSKTVRVQSACAVCVCLLLLSVFFFSKMMFFTRSGGGMTFENRYTACFARYASWFCYAACYQHLFLIYLTVTRGFAG